MCIIEKIIIAKGTRVPLNTFLCTTVHKENTRQTRTFIGISISSILIFRFKKIGHIQIRKKSQKTDSEFNVSIQNDLREAS
jgi:hypothetical protein